MYHLKGSGCERGSLRQRRGQRTTADQQMVVPAPFPVAFCGHASVGSDPTPGHGLMIRGYTMPGTYRREKVDSFNLLTHGDVGGRERKVDERFDFKRRSGRSIVLAAAAPRSRSLLLPSLSLSLTTVVTAPQLCPDPHWNVRQCLLTNANESFWAEMEIQTKNVVSIYNEAYLKFRPRPSA